MAASDASADGLEVARTLLHALVEELSTPRGDERASSRRDAAVQALQSYPRPAALFGGASGGEPIINAAWRATLGELDDLPPAIAAALEAARGGRAMQHLEEVELDREGAPCHLAVAIEALRASPGALVTCADITDWALSLQFNAPADALIWCADPLGSVIYYNARWREVIGRPWQEAIHQREARQWQVALRQATRGDFRSDLELRLRAAAGGYRWYRVQLAGYRERVLCCATDVHVEGRRGDDRDALVVQAQQARAEADRANQLKEEFLAAVSHELRAPLTTMLLWEKVLRERGDDDPEARAQALDAIHQSAIAQSRLVSDMLDYARGISGKLYLDIRSIGIDKIVADALEAVRPLAAQKSLELVRLPGPTDDGLHADATRVRQILDNLLSNAIKYTPPGGRVSVAVRRGAETMAIEVADTGRGIAPELAARIFEPFCQAEDALTRREGGLGLGLTISRQLVELHRGTLEVASDGAGKGARFTLTLPLASTRATTPPLGLRRMHRLDGAHVLVIDDDASVRKALATLLRRVGVTVETAESATVARQRIATKQPQALICDIAMPDEDGYTFIRALRATGSTIPSVAVTAFATDLDAQRAIEAGFDVHLAKPINVERLVDTLNELLAPEPASPA